MKFLTFVDLHEDKALMKEIVQRAKKKDIDFVICGGDISSFGRGLKYNLQQLNSIGKKIYVIPGNHEEPVEKFAEAVKEFSNCINVHEQAFEIENYVFLAYGGGGFAMEDAEFRKLARKWYGTYKNKKIVLVTHMPPYATKLDKLSMGHVGSKDYRKFIERIKPKLAICGHLHETADLQDKIGKTKVIHPGWKGMVIELS